MERSRMQSPYASIVALAATSRRLRVLIDHLVEVEPGRFPSRRAKLSFDEPSAVQRRCPPRPLSRQPSPPHVIYATMSMAIASVHSAGVGMSADRRPSPLELESV